MSPEASAEQWICTVSISILIRKAFAEDKESTFAVIICIIFKSHSSVQLLILNSPCCHSNDLEFKDILGKFLEEVRVSFAVSFAQYARGCLFVTFLLAFTAKCPFEGRKTLFCFFASNAKLLSKVQFFC